MLALGQRVGLAGDVGALALEVGDRVHALAVDVDLEVQVRPERVAGVADLADQLAGLDLLAFLHERASRSGRTGR